jgi:23S rRNA pseudouridine955/2504/2580 synthase
MNELSKDAVSWLTVGEDAAGQRVDNYLGKVLKGVPKSHIYRILRSGEVRVNKGRVGPDARLALGDVVRVPPVRTAAPARAIPARGGFARAGPVLPILFEDDALIADLHRPRAAHVRALCELYSQPVVADALRIPA